MTNIEKLTLNKTQIKQLDQIHSKVFGGLELFTQGCMELASLVGESSELRRLAAARLNLTEDKIELLMKVGQKRVHHLLAINIDRPGPRKLLSFPIKEQAKVMEEGITVVSMENDFRKNEQVPHQEIIPLVELSSQQANLAIDSEKKRIRTSEEQMQILKYDLDERRKQEDKIAATLKSRMWEICADGAIQINWIGKIIPKEAADMFENWCKYNTMNLEKTIKAKQIQKSS